jgi:hypothetical protein
MNLNYHLRTLLFISSPALCFLLLIGAADRAGSHPQYDQSGEGLANDSIPAYFLSGECGTVVSPEQVAVSDSLQKDVDAFTQRFLEQPDRMMTVTIPIKAHIIRRSDGTGGLSLSEWYAALQNLNTLFEPGNLHFEECGPPNIIHSDDYFDFHGNQQSALHSTYGLADVMNVYIPGGDLLTSSGAGACGYAFLPWGGGPNLMLVASSCMNSGNTFAHEVGHYLGLYHTHGIAPSCGPLTDELVNGSNCATAGDRVCDTPADPGLRTGSNCENFWVNNDCVYIGTATDANGQQFMPNTGNIMSYSRHQCRDHFSPAQLARMYFYATTPPRSFHVCTPCSNAPTGLSVTSTGFSHISISWDSLPQAVTYQTRRRILPNGNWLNGAIRTVPYDTWPMQPCQSYELQVRVNCGSGFTPYSPPITAQTQGCGYNYCYSYGTSWNHWISGVEIANVNNPSGNGYGHTDFTNIQVDVEKGQSYPITLTPSTNVASTTLYWRIWIDFNGDGDFTDAGEQVVSITGDNLAPVTANITIPPGAATGTTRMRVTMSTAFFSSSCATAGVRDVEDYNINIQPPPLPCSAPANLSISATGYSHLWASWDSVPGAVSYQSRIKRLPDGNWTVPGSDLLGTGVIWGLTAPCSDYEIQVRSDCGSGYGPYSESVTTQTQGCGDIYCYSYGLSWNQWVAGVNLSNLNNPSGNGFGHSDFTNLQIDVEKGQSYPITLTPGTNTAGTLVYWRVWIDYNGNGDFEDPGEQVLSSLGSSLLPVSASITIPYSAATGATRMRVVMSTAGYSTSCATNNSTRDVEDYTIDIRPAVVNHTAEPSKAAQLLEVFPNPASDWLTVRLPEGVQVLEIWDGTGRLLQRIPAPGHAPYQVNAAGFPRGLLLLSARDGQGRGWYGRVVLQ